MEQLQTPLSHFVPSGSPPSGQLSFPESKGPTADQSKPVYSEMFPAHCFQTPVHLLPWCL